MNNECPECGRQKAYNVQDILNGHCPKWCAIKDPGAEEDCKRIMNLKKVERSKPWPDPPIITVLDTDVKIINQIKDIRSKNNSPWMELLLIALEYNREAALACTRQILENDAAINKLLKELIDG